MHVPINISNAFFVGSKDGKLALPNVVRVGVVTSSTPTSCLSRFCRLYQFLQARCQEPSIGDQDDDEDGCGNTSMRAISSVLAVLRSRTRISVVSRFSAQVGSRGCCILTLPAILSSHNIPTRLHRPRHGSRQDHGPLGLERRTFLTSTLQSLPPYLLGPTVFTGLLITLWLYKCLMTVVFQEKIIYMPYMPPFTRSEKVEDYAKDCRPVVWREIEMRAGDGVRVGGVVGRVEREDGTVGGGVGVDEKGERRRKHVLLCYFHGNGGSLPPRLPMLSNILKTIHARSSQHPDPAVEVEYTLAALSYRGYWTSSGRPSQAGIELDSQALLRWVNETYPTKTGLILWGQSIGAGVATIAAATYARSAAKSDQGRLPISGLILETPFTSIKSMLLALYPQKWLPYRYLGPFLRSHWDSEAALRSLAATTVASKQHTPRVLILAAGKDEIVPAGEAEKLEGVCRAEGLEVERREVRGALHNDATVKKEGREGVVGFIVKLAEEKEG